MDVEKTKAQTAFLAGKLHPHCPDCGGRGLKTNRRAIKMPDGNWWKPYHCQSCGTRFIATVEV